VISLIAAIAALVLALAATAQAGIVQAGIVQATVTPGWRAVAAYPQSGEILSVSASSAANAWAAGQEYSPCNMCLFTTHWNGKKWQPLDTPPGLRHQINLITSDDAVAAIPGGRAWVFVWGEENELGTTLLSAVQWTGSGWSSVHNFPGSPLLTTAAASGPDDVWGFGDTGLTGQTPWAVRYNGKSWSQVPIPVVPAAASGSAAAGDWVTGTVATQPRKVAVVHWSKGAWRTVALPKISVPKGEQMRPGFIAAATPSNVWATISLARSVYSAPATTILLHWNGKAWSRVALPKALNGDVYGLAGDGDGGIWAASYTKNEPGVLESGLVMDHYSGGRWTRAAVAAEKGFVTTLNGDMELIPGTRSVLAAAELNHPTPGSAGSESAVLKYGP
jgi:hypothetical protein